MFVDWFVSRNRERRRSRAAVNVQLLRTQLNLAGYETRILCSGRTFSDGPAYPYHVFMAQRLRRRKHVALRIERDLRYPITVAQVDKNQTAVISAAVNPTAEFDILSFVCGSKAAARVQRATLPAQL